MRRPSKTPPALRDQVLTMVADAILSNAGLGELAQLDDLLGGAITGAPGQWRRLAMVREAALLYAATVARAGFLAGLGQGQP